MSTPFVIGPGLGPEATSGPVGISTDVSSAGSLGGSFFSSASCADDDDDKESEVIIPHEEDMSDEQLVEIKDKKQLESLTAGAYILFRGVAYLVLDVPASPRVSLSRVAIPLLPPTIAGPWGRAANHNLQMKSLGEFEKKLQAGVFTFQPSQTKHRCRLLAVSESVSPDSQSPRTTLVLSTEDNPSLPEFEISDPVVVVNTNFSDEIAAIHSAFNAVPETALYHYTFDAVLVPCQRPGRSNVKGDPKSAWCLLNWAAEPINVHSVRLTGMCPTPTPQREEEQEEEKQGFESSSDLELEVMPEEMLLLTSKVRALSKLTSSGRSWQKEILCAVEVQPGFVFLVDIV